MSLRGIVWSLLFLLFDGDEGRPRGATRLARLLLLIVLLAWLAHAVGIA